MLWHGPEMSSGQAAHELKKRRDNLIKIDKPPLTLPNHRICKSARETNVSRRVRNPARSLPRPTWLLSPVAQAPGLSAPAADAGQCTTMQLEQSPTSPDARQGQTRRKPYAQTMRSDRSASRKNRMGMHALQFSWEQCFPV